MTKSMPKSRKCLLYFLVAIIIGLFAGLIYMNARQKEVLLKRDEAKTDKISYIEKKNECSGYIFTSSNVVNSAGLSDCGARMAIDSLSFESLYNIYHNKCYSGFGVAVYGCANPYTKRVYVCSPGTSLYDRRNTYVSRYFIYYKYISYSCDIAKVKNTIRHELLHLVYSDLSYSDKQRVNAKLSSYRPLYASQLASYSPSEHDGELFVRVGADGKQVDDIELAELYSRVSSAYTAQKQKYYSELASVADKYIDEYTNLSTEYTVFCIIFVILIIINIIVIAILIHSLKKKDSSHRKIDKPANDVISLYRKNRNSPKSVLDKDYKEEDLEDLNLEALQEKINSMSPKTKEKTKKKSPSNISEEFEHFKKKYGIIDLEG